MIINFIHSFIILKPHILCRVARDVSWLQLALGERRGIPCKVKTSINIILFEIHLYSKVAPLHVCVTSFLDIHTVLSSSWWCRAAKKKPMRIFTSLSGRNQQCGHVLAFWEKTGQQTGHLSQQSANLLPSLLQDQLLCVNWQKRHACRLKLNRAVLSGDTVS